MFRTISLFLGLLLVASACSSDEPTTALANPERAVVAWFEAIDAGDAATATAAVDDDAFSIILSIENDLPADVTAQYLSDGIPQSVQNAYWESFAAGFRDFASRPISTLTVGESVQFEAEGQTFASVPIAAGPGTDSVVFAKKTESGEWVVDMVATLGDGFSKLLQNAHGEIPDTESGDRVASAYLQVVVPALWAAITDGTFGPDFDRVALATIGQIEG